MRQPQVDRAVRRDDGERRETWAGVQRVMVGKTPDQTAMVMLADPQGRPRLRLRVDSTGAGRMELLDGDGQVTYSVPGH